MRIVAPSRVPALAIWSISACVFYYSLSLKNQVQALPMFDVGENEVSHQPTVVREHIAEELKSLDVNTLQKIGQRDTHGRLKPKYLLEVVQFCS